MSGLQSEISLWPIQVTEYIVELRQIANSIDEVHATATKANIAGSITGAVGGILSIVGLVASPFTMGSSLLLTGAGMVAGTVGGVTNVTASVSDKFNQESKQKRVNEIIQQYLKKQQELANRLELLNKTIESIIKIETKNVPNAVFVGTTQGIINSLSHISTVTSAVTKNAFKVFKSVSGILAGLTVAWDIYSVFKDSVELKAKETEISQMIREVAESMEEERGNFKKIESKLKDCTELQKFLEQCGR
ncbi:apolipoprotein L3-like [Hypanus sabinus]|uniref:apolipoprotein L3-like n=1 Tax=Hypanus sabinus TaxID=79690 RepID=UPI0028C40A5D|nr:apolipoprotein L3-like [Hypanus sabinus]